MPKVASERRKKKMHPWALAAPIQPNYPTIYNYIHKPQKTKLSVEAQILTLNMGSNERKQNDQKLEWHSCSKYDRGRKQWCIM